MVDASKLVETLHRYTFYTVGCTDPVAIALAASRAAELLDDPPTRVNVVTDKNIFKNSFSVGIPGTDKFGLHMAAALGAVVKGKGDALDALAFLANSSEEEIESAEGLVSGGFVRVDHDSAHDDLYVEAVVQSASGTARAIVRHEHDRVVLLEKDGEVVFESEGTKRALMDFDVIIPIETSLEDLVEAVNQLGLDELDFLLQGLEVNLAAGAAGLEARAGLGVGANIVDMDAGSQQPGQLVVEARALSAAATDARMAGLEIPIVGCFGSGTHGVILFNTIGAVGKSLGKEPLEIGRALALGIAVLGLFKNQSSILTPHCGSGLDAGAGAAVGVAYLLDGDADQMRHALNYLVANHYGTVCDGAKPSCAVKIGSSAGTAVEGAWFAKHGMEVAAHGVVGESFNDTVRNVGELTRKGLATMDETIVEILKGKGELC